MNSTYTYMDYLDEQLESPSVTFHYFLLEYKKNQSNPICFVEGYDDSYYYRPRIEARTDNLRAKFIQCNGKKGVLDIFETINQRSEFNSCKIFYFADRDFDNNIISDRIYVTPTYSIENLYTSLECFKLILEDVFHRGENDPDYQNAINLFLERQKEFHGSVLELNTLLACDRDVNPQMRNRISMNGVKITNYVSIELFKVEQLPAMKELLDGFKHIEEQRKTAKIKEYEKLEKQKKFRGKFELQFFCCLLDKLVKDSNIRSSDKRTFFGRRVKTVEIDLSKSELLTLSSFAETPDSLVNYIERIWSGSLSEKVS